MAAEKEGKRDGVGGAKGASDGGGERSGDARGHKDEAGEVGKEGKEESGDDKEAGTKGKGKASDCRGRQGEFGEDRGPKIRKGEERADKDAKDRSRGGDRRRRPGRREKRENGRGENRGGEGALGGVEFTPKSVSEGADNGGKGRQEMRGRGEDGKIVDVGSNAKDRWERKKGPNEEVKNEEEKVGGNGATLADTCDNGERRRGAMREREIRGRGREDVRDVIV